MQPSSNNCYDTGLREECGVFGIYDLDGADVSPSIYYGLSALQHRGQESCGIAVSDTSGPKGHVKSYKGLGLVNEVFKESKLEELSGNIGIGQLIALRYGSVPVVRETGGLKDTIIPYDKYTKQGNGFRFADYNAHEMMYALKRALSAYENYEEWKQIVENAMNSDYSWKESAREYKALYEKLTGSEA